ncbi:hypothetical protein ABPG74_003814 [Tetrahymena malaccensis]
MCYLLSNLLNKKREKMFNYLWLIIVGCQESQIPDDFIQIKLKQLNKFGLDVNKDQIINYQNKDEDLIPFLYQIRQEEEKIALKSQIKQQLEYQKNQEKTYLSQLNFQIINSDTKSIIETQLENLGLYNLKSSLQQYNQGLEQEEQEEEEKEEEEKEEDEDDELKKIFSDINLPKHIFNFGKEKLKDQMNTKFIQEQINQKDNQNIQSITAQVKQQKVNPEMNGTFEEFTTQVYNYKTQLGLMDNLIEEQSDFNEDDKIELQTIYIYKDKKALQNILKAPQSQLEFSQKVKQTLLFPEEQENSDQTEKKCFYTKLYFYLKLQKFEKCLETIFSLVQSPQSELIYDEQVFNKILQYIKNHTKKEDLKYLVDIFNSTCLEEMNNLFEKYVQIIKNNTNVSNENLEQTINQTSLIIFKTSLNFMQLKEKQNIKVIEKKETCNQQNILPEIKSSQTDITKIINFNDIESIQNCKNLQSLLMNTKLQQNNEETISILSGYEQNQIFDIVKNFKSEKQQKIDKNQDKKQNGSNQLLLNIRESELIQNQEDELLKDNKVPVFDQSSENKVKFKEEQKEEDGEKDQKEKDNVNEVEVKEQEKLKNNNDLKVNPDEQVKQNKCLLTLDGGGVKGIFQLFILSALESMTNMLCDDLFYFIGGTSIGGIIALGLRMRISAKDLLKIIIRHFQDNLFSQNKIQHLVNVVFNTESLNPTSNLHEILKNQIFNDKCFLDIKKNTLITSAYLDDSQTIIPVCFIRFTSEPQGSQKGLDIIGLYRVKKQFNNYEKPVEFLEEFQDVQFKNAPLWQIAASTSAAFPILNKFKFTFDKKKNLEHEFVDGGYLLNNVDILLIEFLKQIDTNYNPNDKLSQYFMLSINTQYGSFEQTDPPFKESDTDESVKLPSYIAVGALLNHWDKITKNCQKNSDQSVFLTVINQKNEKFEYMRLQPISHSEIGLDQANLMTLNYLEQISHKFLVQKQDQLVKIIAFLNQKAKALVFTQIQNLEVIYPKDYEQLNTLLQDININRIKSEYKNFDEYYTKEGKRIEECLVDTLFNIQIRNNQVKIKKMTDFESYKFWMIFSNRAYQYYETKFQGVIQLAASIGSVLTIKKIFGILKIFDQNIKDTVLNQIGDCKWNALIGASANQMVRTFIYLLMSIKDQDQDSNIQNNLRNKNGTQTIYQFKDEENNKLLKDIIHTPCKEKYYYLKRCYTHYLEISDQNFKDLVEWWLI